jgi:hypothetical protein
VNGDAWGTTAGWYYRANGATQGPFLDAAAAGGLYQPVDATLTALAGAGAANTFPYFTSTDVLGNASITAAGLAILDDANAAAQRDTLGLGTSNSVEFHDFKSQTYQGYSAVLGESDSKQGSLTLHGDNAHANAEFILENAAEHDGYTNAWDLTPLAGISTGGDFQITGVGGSKTLGLCFQIDAETGESRLHHGLYVAGGPFHTTTVTTFTADDTSPSVSAGNIFKVPGTWTSGHNITTFDDGVSGQTIVVIGGDSDCVVVNGSNLKLESNWTAAAGYCLPLTFDGTNWNEISARGARTITSSWNMAAPPAIGETTPNTVRGTSINGGVAHLTQGSLNLYGNDGSGAPYANFYNAVDDHTATDYWQLKAGGAFSVSASGGTANLGTVFSVNPSTGAVSFPYAVGVTGVVTASNAANAIAIGTSCTMSSPPAIGGTTPNNVYANDLKVRDSATQSGELVTNGTMEVNGNWTTLGTPTACAQTNAQAHGETYSWIVQSDAQYEGIYQDLAATYGPGTRFAWDVWVYGSAGDYVRIDMAISSSAFYSEVDLLAAGWNHFTGYASPTSVGVCRIRVMSYTASMIFYVDDVSVKTIAGNGLINGTLGVGGASTFIGNGYFVGNCSALTFTDRSEWPEEKDPLTAVAAIKGKNGKLDHESLPEFTRRQIKRTVPITDENGEPTGETKEIVEEGRDLGAMVSMLTVAVQQLKEANEDLQKQVAELKKPK